MEQEYCYLQRLTAYVCALCRIFSILGCVYLYRKVMLIYYLITNKWCHNP